MASQEEDNFVQAIPSTTPATAVIHISRDGCCLGRPQPPGAPWGGLPVLLYTPSQSAPVALGCLRVVFCSAAVPALYPFNRGKRKEKNKMQQHTSAQKSEGVRWGRRWSSLFGCMAPLSHTQGRPLPSRNTHELTLRQPVS